MDISGKQSASLEKRMETIIGNLLRTGVILAGIVVAAGAVIYLARYGASLPYYHIFRGEPSDLCSVKGIIKDALQLRARGIIQFGFLLLIATPIMRVAISFIAFLRMHDGRYVIVTLLVLCFLTYSLLIGSL